MTGTADDCRFSKTPTITTYIEIDFDLVFQKKSKTNHYIESSRSPTN
jgi:hypothetical protein